MSSQPQSLKPYLIYGKTLQGDIGKVLRKFLHKCIQHKEFTALLSSHCFQALVLFCLCGGWWCFPGLSVGRRDWEKLQASAGQGLCLICVFSEPPQSILCSEQAVSIVTSHSSLKQVMVSTENNSGLSIVSVIIKVLFISKFTDVRKINIIESAFALDNPQLKQSRYIC